MPKCNCAGSSCGCSVVAGAGMRVAGTGTAANPFTISLNVSSLVIGDSVAVTNSTSIEFGKRGSGATGDPVIITGQVVVRSPDGNRWSPTISNAGAVTWAAAGTAPSGSSGPDSGASTTGGSGFRFYDGSAWESRGTTGKVVWVSLGFTGVPVPASFIDGDVWMAENA